MTVESDYATAIANCLVMGLTIKHQFFIQQEEKTKTNHAMYVEFFQYFEQVTARNSHWLVTLLWWVSQSNCFGIGFARVI